MIKKIFALLAIAVLVSAQVRVLQVDTNDNPISVSAAGVAGTANANVTTVQGIAGMTKLLVTPDSVALPANQSVNVAQLGGSAPTASPAAGSLGVGQTNVVGTTDPCQLPTVLKSSKPINVSSATTTSLVAVSGSTAVYVCNVSMTISPSGTTADTALFEYGTGATCTSPTVLTGTFGNGDLTTAVAVTPITIGWNGTIMTAPASNGICILSAGTNVSIQGVITYVQQ